MADVEFNPELVVMLDGVKTYQEAEKVMAEHLVELGYAKNTYPEAIRLREVDYPTGLNVEGINAAMPHCDIVNVNSAAVCVGVLKDPVAWRRMDDPDSTCPVSLVTMLALTEAHAHLDMLQKVVALIQDQDLMAQIVAAPDAQGVYDLVAPKLA